MPRAAPVPDARARLGQAPRTGSATLPTTRRQARLPAPARFALATMPERSNRQSFELRWKNSRRIGIAPRQFLTLQHTFLDQASQTPRPSIRAAHHTAFDEKTFPLPRCVRRRDGSCTSSNVSSPPVSLRSANAPNNSSVDDETGLEAGARRRGTCPSDSTSESRGRQVLGSGGATGKPALQDEDAERRVRNTQNSRSSQHMLEQPSVGAGHTQGNGHAIELHAPPRFLN